MRIKIKVVSLYSALLNLTIFTLMLSDLFGVQILGYSDEILGCCCLIYVGIIFFRRLLFQSTIQKTTLVIIMHLMCLAGVGILGNTIYSIQNNKAAILLDLFLFIKPYGFLLFTLLTITSRRAKEIINFWGPISKCMLSVLAGFAIISSVFHIGMIGEGGEFIFFAKVSVPVAEWTIFFMAIIYVLNVHRKLIYFFMGAIIAYFSDSGLGLLSVGLIFMIYIFFERKKSFKWYYCIPIGIIGLLLSYDEIISYLLDPEAPRAKFLIYAFITANQYFPMGAGFGTFASATAAKYYSNLYYQYNFNESWGMSPTDTRFLTDNYYPQIIGQLGYIGAAVWVTLVYKIVKKLILTIPEKHVCYGTLYLYGCLLIAGLGFGIGSAWGCAVYLILPILSKFTNKICE